MTQYHKVSHNNPNKDVRVEFEEVKYVKNVGIFFSHSQLFWDPLIQRHIESRNYLVSATGLGQKTNILPI